MSPEWFDAILGSVLTLVTSGPLAIAAAGAFSGNYERSAKRVANAVAVRDALEASLARSSVLAGTRVTKAQREQLLDAERSIVYESLAFSDVVRDYWQVRKGRALRLILGGVLIVLAVVASNFIWFGELSNVWIVTVVALYLFGCVLAGAGLVDLRLNSLRLKKHAQLTNLGLFAPVVISERPPRSRRLIPFRR